MPLSTSPTEVPDHGPAPGIPLRAQTEQLSFWRVSYGLVGGFIGLAAVVALALVKAGGENASGAFGVTWLLAGAVLALAGIAWGIGVANLRFKRYLCEHYPLAGVRLQDGVWWQTETWIPLARLQHLDVKQGPLDRHWGMATLSLHTAGTHDHVLHIKGLPLEQAQSLRAALLPHLHVHHV